MDTKTKRRPRCARQSSKRPQLASPPPAKHPANVPPPASHVASQPPPASLARDDRALWKKLPPVAIESQGDLLSVRFTEHEPHDRASAARRGVVSEFSADSRQRMLQLMARIDFRRAGFVCFLTLTFPDLPAGAPSPELANRHRLTFLKRLRRMHPECSVLWRREWEARKSGRFAGFIVPHYHLLAFRLPFLPHEELQEMWRGVLGFDGYVRTEIRKVANARMARSYVGKYMSKPNAAPAGSPPPAPGSPGGAESDPDGAPATGPADSDGEPRSLVSVPYLPGDAPGVCPLRENPPDAFAGSAATAPASPTPKQSVGRAWGVFNRRHLPLGEAQRVVIEAGPWLRDVRGLAVARIPKLAEYPFRGCTLFDDQADALRRYFERLAEEEGCRVERD